MDGEVQARQGNSGGNPEQIGKTDSSCFCGAGEKTSYSLSVSGGFRDSLSKVGGSPALLRRSVGVRRGRTWGSSDVGELLLCEQGVLEKLRF